MNTTTRSPASMTTPSGANFTQVADRLMRDAAKVDAEARRLRDCADMKVAVYAETQPEREARLHRSAGSNARYAGRLLAMADSYRAGDAPTEASHQGWYRREGNRSAIRVNIMPA